MTPTRRKALQAEEQQLLKQLKTIGKEYDKLDRMSGKLWAKVDRITLQLDKAALNE